MTHVGIFDEAIELQKLKKRIKDLEKINKEHQKLNGTLRQTAAEEKKRRQFAEGELSIVKTTAVTNSPEMRNAQSEIAALKGQLHTESEKHKKELAQAREDHQFDNLVHAKELKELANK